MAEQIEINTGIKVLTHEHHHQNLENIISNKDTSIKFKFYPGTIVPESVLNNYNLELKINQSGSGGNNLTIDSDYLKNIYINKDQNIYRYEELLSIKYKRLIDAIYPGIYESIKNTNNELQKYIDEIVNFRTNLIGQGRLVSYDKSKVDFINKKEIFYNKNFKIIRDTLLHMDKFKIDDKNVSEEFKDNVLDGRDERVANYNKLVDDLDIFINEFEIDLSSIDKKFKMSMDHFESCLRLLKYGIYELISEHNVFIPYHTETSTITIYINNFDAGFNIIINNQKVLFKTNYDYSIKNSKFEFNGCTIVGFNIYRNDKSFSNNKIIFKDCSISSTYIPEPVEGNKSDNFIVFDTCINMLPINRRIFESFYNVLINRSPGVIDSYFSDLELNRLPIFLSNNSFKGSVNESNIKEVLKYIEDNYKGTNKRILYSPDMKYMNSKLASVFVKEDEYDLEDGILGKIIQLLLK